MLALQVRLNGELKATCGANDLEHLVAYIRAQAPSGQVLTTENVEHLVQCFGFPASGNEVQKWVAAKLQVGDEINLKLVETSSADNPIDRQTIDPHHETKS
jgi:hypothetical protein